MNKSVYSLVLMDRVVEQVDRLAYAMHTNRSNMVNQILAEYCSMLTPEKRMLSTIEELEALLGQGGFQPQHTPGSSMLVIRSALNYKYNPTVRYRVALYREPQPDVGELQVQLRTQNRGLIEAVQSFLETWIPLEQRYCGNIAAVAADGRYTRAIRPNPRFEEEPALLSQSIENYVNHFDRAIKLFFEYHAAPQTRKMAENELLAYVRSGLPLI